MLISGQWCGGEEDVVRCEMSSGVTAAAADAPAAWICCSFHDWGWAKPPFG